MEELPQPTVEGSEGPKAFPDPDSASQPVEPPDSEEPTDQTESSELVQSSGSFSVTRAVRESGWARRQARTSPIRGNNETVYSE